LEVFFFVPVRTLFFVVLQTVGLPHRRAFIKATL
jgi:hypothetical protein